MLCAIDEPDPLRGGGMRRGPYRAARRRRAAREGERPRRRHGPDARHPGARVEERPDGLVIEGPTLTGGTIDSAGDHRIAMSAAVAALDATAPVTITDAACADVSFPGFYDFLAKPAATEETQSTPQSPGSRAGERKRA
jgi:hypothetical protein